MTNYHAINVIEPSLEKTKKLLFKPFKAKLWLKLALVVFLIGWSASNFNFSPMGEKSDSSEFSSKFQNTISIIPFAVIILLALVLIAVVLFLVLISFVARFVFLESVLKNEVSILADLKKHFGKGTQVLLFGIGVGLVTSVLIFLMSLPAILVLSQGWQVKLIILLPYILVAILIFIPVILLLSIVSSFTTDFTIPLMLKSDNGVIKTWRRLLGLIKAKKMQFLVYILLKIVLKIIAGILGFIIVLIFLIVLALIIALPLVVLGIILFVIFGINPVNFIPAGFGLFMLVVSGIILAILAILAVSYAIIFITLPIPVFFRYYSVLFLEKILTKEKKTTKKKDKPTAEKSYYVD